MIEPLVITFDVKAPLQHAFDTWTAKIDSWWPRSHSWTGDADLSVVLEPAEGGRIYEKLPDGAERDWGEVTQWEPPARFAYLWHLMRDRAQATLVDIRFTAVDDDLTRVEIVHTGWENLGVEGQDWRDANRGGWSGVLPHYVEAVES